MSILPSTADRGSFWTTLPTSTFVVSVCLFIGILLKHASGIPAAGESVLILAVLMAGMGDRRLTTLIVAGVACAAVLAKPVLGIESLSNEQLIWCVCLWLAVALLHRHRSGVPLAQIKGVFAEAPTAMCVLDPTGKVVDANRAFSDLLLAEQADVKGRHVRELVGEEVWQTLQASNDTLDAGKALDLDCELQLLDGSTIHISGHGRGVLNRLNEPIYYVLQLLDLSDQMQTNRALHEVQSRFENIIEYSADLILIVDPDGRITHHNPRAAQVFTGADIRLTGARAVQLFDKKDRPIFQSHLDTSLVNAEVVHPIERLRLNLPGEVQVDARLVGLPDTPGIKGTIVTCRVITEWLASLARLRSSELRFSRIFHSSPDAILMMRNRDSMILDFNEGFTRLLGYAREDAVGQKLIDLPFWVSEDDRQQLLAELDAHQEVIDYETVLRTRNNSVVNVEISIRYMDLDGEVCVLCTGRDISKRILAENALRESEEKFERVFTNSPDGIVVIRNDGVIVDINDVFVSHSEYEREQLVGRSVLELPVFADLGQLQEMGERLSQDRAYTNIEVTFRTRTGKHIPALVSATTFEIAGQRCALCIAKDMRELRTAEERLRSSEERFRGAFENAPMGILLIDLDGCVFQANRFASQVLGYEDHQLPGTPLSRLVPDDDRDALKNNLSDLPGARDHAMQMERRMCRADGLEVWTNFHIALQCDAEGQPLYHIAQFADITEMRLGKERMERMAFYDTLTDLGNRRLFQDRLNQVIEQKQRSGESAALLYLDLDRFKRVNDTLGHDAGDQLLREVGMRIRRNVRKQNTVARLGGDEFTILLSDIQLSSDAAIVAERILAEMRNPIHLSGQRLVITPSIGITLFPADGTEGHVLMKNADLAMYKAKERGRNNFQFFNEEMNSLAERNLRIENELRDALSRNEFELYYQPKVRISDQQMMGTECLLRWNHPTRGVVSPVEFMDVAEETGLIHEIGSWVIGEACRGAKRLQDASSHPVTTAVNISTQQFRDPNLVQTIRRGLRESGLPPHLLEVEITETMLMEDVEAATITVERMSDLGIKLAIDDFGTGYSSLNYLKRFPIDTVKVDRSFVKDIPHSSDDMEITAAVIAMAHRLKMEVVAEGVETAEQLEFLTSQKCEYAQGFLFSKPQPLDAVEQLVAPNVHLLRGS